MMMLSQKAVKEEGTRTTQVWSWAVLFILFFVCCLTRLLHLGDKAIMHDEGLFVYYTWDQLYRNWNYGYMPILHGPAMLQLQALVFHVFGVTDFTMRLGCALLGIASFWWIWLLRPWLTPMGTWIALALYTVSPGITYYQRFFRNDSLFLFTTLWIVTSLAYWWRWGNPRWLASAMIGVAVLFCNKESSIFVYFSIVTFFLLLVIYDLTAQWFYGRGRGDVQDVKRIPGFPNPAWIIFAGGLFVVLVLTQVFEGLQYDSNVVNAIGHDWILRDVRSIPLALDWWNLTAEKAPDAGAARNGVFWRRFYSVLFLCFLLAGAVGKIAIERGLGAQRVLSKFWSLLYEGRYYLIGAAGASLAIYILVFTTTFQHRLGVFEIYEKTWSYWGGQHEWGRIGGPFHQHLLDMLVYELPAVLIVVTAWIRGLFRVTWTRLSCVSFLLLAIPVAAFHKLLFSGLEAYPAGANVLAPLEIDYLKNILLATFVAGLIGLLVPRFGKALLPIGFVALLVYSIFYFTSAKWDKAMSSRIYRNGENVELSGRHVNLNDFMEIQFNFDGGASLAIVLVLIFFATICTWKALERGERFHAFLIWWFVTAAGAASYAREAVPQVGIHAMLPLILLGASYAGRGYAQIKTRGGRYALIAIVGMFVLWNAKSTFQLNLYNSDDIRERMVYGHTADTLKEHADFVVDYHKIASIRVGADDQPVWIREYNRPAMHKDVRVAVQSDPTVWPIRWYLRDIDWREEKNRQNIMEGDYEFVFVNTGDARGDSPLKDKYHLYRGSALRFWLPRPLSFDRLLDIWKTGIPGHYHNNSTAGEAEDAKKEWAKIWNYMMYRETFDGGIEGSGNVSGTDYYFGVRKDLY